MFFFLMYFYLLTCLGVLGHPIGVHTVVFTCVCITLWIFLSSFRFPFLFINLFVTCFKLLFGIGNVSSSSSLRFFIFEFLYIWVYVVLVWWFSVFVLVFRISVVLFTVNSELFTEIVLIVMQKSSLRYLCSSSILPYKFHDFLISDDWFLMHRLFW